MSKDLKKKKYKLIVLREKIFGQHAMKDKLKKYIK